MHDKFRKKYRVSAGTARSRQQIAHEAARRIIRASDPPAEAISLDWLGHISENDFYIAKRKAAAVLGHHVRPGDLPSDAEVREQLVILWRSRANPAENPSDAPMPEPEEEASVIAMVDHLDRFAIYKMRLVPLESVKQNSRYHPEGDVLYHSLQVFHLARDVRPYDEEFLLAALLHDIGKAIDPQNHVAAAVASLRGAVTERTLWLIEHHMDLLHARERTLSVRQRRELEGSEHLEDLKLLRTLDDAGRVPGMAVDTLDEVLDYLRGLEHEAYLND